MRLIDANKIEFNTVRYPIGAPWPPNKEKQATMGEIEWVSKYQIENRPTVEAIPIEWLKKHLPKYDDYIHTRMYHDEYNENIYSAGHEDGWEACRKAILEDVFEEWKEENEIY